MVEKFGLRYVGVSCGKLRRYLSWQNVKDAFKVPVGIWQAWKELRRFRPQVVFSKGGFVSVPVNIAAALLRIPVVVHESDLRPGLANKISFRFARRICLSFDESVKFLSGGLQKKVVVTGNPVRKELEEGDAEKGKKMLGFDRFRPIVLVMGGSSGAIQINNLVRDNLEELVKRYQIVHVVGKGNLEMGLHHKGYKQFEFLGKELFDVYAAAALVVSRAGANSLAEIGSLGKKAIIIPLSAEVSRGDQIDNAQIYAKNFGWSVLSGEIKNEDFVKALDLAIEHEINPDAKVKNGRKEIVNLILQLAK